MTSNSSLKTMSAIHNNVEREPRIPSGSSISSRSLPKKTSNSSFTSQKSPSSLTNTAGPSAIPRPSFSSSRSGSGRKREVDFEAVLLNPNSTIFLHGSPHLSPTAEMPGEVSGKVQDQSDTPQTIEKRSYEEDLHGLEQGAGPAGPVNDVMPSGGVPKARGPSEGSDVSAATKLSNPILQTPNVVPATPPSGSSAYSNKRVSQITVRSQDSATSGGQTWSSSTARLSDSPRRKAGPSIGLDAELHETKPMKSKPSAKRRSIFHLSPGTASSPDLATLVKKAKETKTGQAPQAPGATVPTPQLPRGAASPVQSSAPRQASAGARMTASPSIQSQLSSVHEAPSERSRTSTSHDDWERFSGTELSSVLSKDRLPSIAEKPSRGHDDGNKTLRNKAKGMFGKMFGTSTSRESTPQTSPANSTSSRFTSNPDYPRPPVPPIPANYAAEVEGKRRGSSAAPPTPSALGGIAIIDSRMYSEPQTRDEYRRSTAPKIFRHPSDSTSMSLDKPLPIPQPDKTQEGPSSDTPMSQQLQPANVIMEPTATTAKEPTKASTGQAATPSFSEDVEGIFKGIGQGDPTRGLGVPLDPNDTGRVSQDTARETKRFPSDLGRRPSQDGAKVLSTENGGHRDSLVVPVPSRASSLPPNSPRLDVSPGTPSIPGRSISSPQPSPALPDGSPGLIPPPRPSSRASTTSSLRRQRQDEPERSEGNRSTTPQPQLADDGAESAEPKTPSRPPRIEATKLASPLKIPPVSDFYPDHDPVDETLRARRESDLPPLSPASVRLVSSRPGLVVATPGGELGQRGSFRDTTPWGRQTPPIRSDSQVVTPESVSPKRIVRNGTDEDEEKGRKLACEFLDEDFTNVSSEKVAMFLGAPRSVNRAALKYYMQYFDMKGQSLVEAFRDLCAKLYLKAESQEIDRILEGFSTRYYECNPTTVFGTPGVVHTVAGAMLMLNTDLHIAELSKHMTRSDFVRNVMRTLKESTPMTDRGSTPDLVREDSGRSITQASVASFAPSPASVKSNAIPAGLGITANRSVSVPIVPAAVSRAESERSVTLSAAESKIRASSNVGSSTTLSSFSYTKAWEGEAEAALRDIYSQVRSDKILLPIASVQDNSRQSVISLGTLNNDAARLRAIRNAGNHSNDRVNALKRGSMRSIPGSLNNPHSSSYSSDSHLSPATSYAASMNGSSGGGFTPTIGFAHNLSHTVIREHDDEARSVDSHASTSTIDDDLDDDELALLGAPWAKEGMLWKRSGNEPVHKKTTKKDWKQYFVVVQRGELLLFTFGEGTGSMAFGAVGGGNWLNNANTAGRFSLIQTNASSMPGGYSRDRPYCFTVGLPNSEVLFLQAGTEDLVSEWITTCSYWSARNSRPPLQGGVSNMEYGWQKVSDGLAPHHDDDTVSVKSSRSNMSKLGSHRRGAMLPGDKAFVNDWKPPPPTLMASHLDEESQLEALTSYVRTVTEELDAHKALEEPMMRLYTSGSKNASKAHHNFQIKARYLVDEIYRYQNYVDSLRAAIALRVKKQGEKRLEKSLARSTTSLHRANSEANLLYKHLKSGNGENRAMDGAESHANGEATNGQNHGGPDDLNRTIRKNTRNYRKLAISSVTNGAGENGDDAEGPLTPTVRRGVGTPA